MFKVLIVDDEKIICQLVRHLIDWQELDLSFAGEAYNYTQALSLIREKMPDIVITDIRMPGQNGISLIEAIRSQNRDISVIAISGCREFEYARSMLKFDVEDYLLKPIQKKELTAALERITEKKKAALENRDLEHTSTAKCRELFMRELLDPTFSFPEKPVSEINKEYKFLFTDGLFSILALKADFSPEVCTDSLLCSRILDNIRQSITAAIRELACESESAIKNSRLYILINANESESEFTDRIKTLLAPVAAMNLQKHELVGLSIALDLFRESPGMARIHVKTVDRLLDHRMDFSPNELILSHSVSIKEDPEHLKELYGRIDSSLKSLMDTLEQGTFIRQIHDLLTSSELTNYESLCTALRVIQKTETLTNGENPPSPCFLAAGQRLENCISRDSAEDIVKVYLEETLRAWLLSKTETEKRPIRLVKTYIEENYRLDINLNSLSRLVYLNPIYLSSLFKQETGISITDYIIETRLKKARELLRDIPMFIGDIASAVGYRDTRYFSRLFLKHVGVKPSEYRKYHS